MDKQRLIDDLKFAIDLISYDPKTEKILPKNNLNYFEKSTVDSIEAAIKYINNSLTYEEINDCLNGFEAAELYHHVPTELKKWLFKGI